MIDNKSNHFFFNPPTFKPTSKEESDAYQKALMENETIWKRAGYRGIFNRLLKSGFFEINNLTKSQAVLSASFEEAVALISIENSLN